MFKILWLFIAWKILAETLQTSCSMTNELEQIDTHKIALFCQIIKFRYMFQLNKLGCEVKDKLSYHNQSIEFYTISPVMKYRLKHLFYNEASILQN